MNRDRDRIERIPVPRQYGDTRRRVDSMPNFDQPILTDEKPIPARVDYPAMSNEKGMPAAIEYPRISHRLSAISAGVGNSIDKIWFTRQGQSAEVASLPVGAAFDIHCNIRVTKDYIQRAVGKEEWGGWGVVVMVINKEDRMARWAFATAEWGIEIIEHVIPDKGYGGYTREFIMPSHDVTFNVLLLGSLVITDVRNGIELEPLRELVGDLI